MSVCIFVLFIDISYDYWIYSYYDLLQLFYLFCFSFIVTAIILAILFIVNKFLPSLL